MAKKEYNKTRTSGRRTVTKTRSADGSKSRTVTRAKKDGTTKVKSKTKSGNTVTKRKLILGKKSENVQTKPLSKVKIKGAGSPIKTLSTENQLTQSVKGKETVRNRKAKKGEVKKTKSKIDGTRTTTTRTTTMRKGRGSSAIYKKREDSRVTPAKRTTVKTKIKKRGRR
jgi:hypothetical protein